MKNPNQSHFAENFEKTKVSP